MKIGDEVFVHGYVDEIRKDCIIIRNNGGYFGTVAEEVLLSGIERVADTPQTDLVKESNEVVKDLVKTDCAWK